MLGKKLLILVTGVLLLVGCNNKASSSASQQPSSSSAEIGPELGLSLKVDYTNDGGAGIPTEWNDSDTSNTVRKATYDVDGYSFSLEFVGKWYNSTGKQEYQTKKDPVSYIRSASDLAVRRITIEVFKADYEVYTTKDHTGTKLEGTKATAEHGDGDAMTFTVNSIDWSVLGTETYKGSNINFYSFTFYF